ncbi:hypothetical protein C0V70_08770 [Bacteriovorax stolpii]|uniref:Uncharacterized protein n=1 Tax=Bacteriovorax stolpii TaxID=960 RepID=A0A2K9NSY7_BACTC|nr:hypothetical protein [Bacteriovorax stolpii]AUN98195.1 hypothetical protein C0V70_08770 [Bacteriovorax stolpii]TDP52114.1 hypothetical protein C8D79_2763 [Bacteriovorax stolpii]
MSKKTVFSMLALTMALTTSTFAEIKTYQSTDNTGLNKKEQIDNLERYLMELSGSLKNMEAKLDANAIKIKTLEDIVKAIREQDIKKIQDQLGEKKTDSPAAAQAAPGPTMQEMDKLKADILTLKNEDIEKVQSDIRNLNSSVEYIQKMLKIGQK